MPTAKVTSKGQITIPIEVRKALKLKAGDRIDFYETEDGTYSLRPKTGSLMDLKGIFQRMGIAPLGYVLTDEEMDEAIARQVAESDFETLSDEGKKLYLNSDRGRRTA